VKTCGAFNYFNGTIDEARIYNRSLSAQEIADLYNAAKARLDYADIRFALANDTALSYWLESDKSAWVKIRIPAGRHKYDFCILWELISNPSDNPRNVFNVFDDLTEEANSGPKPIQITVSA